MDIDQLDRVGFERTIREVAAWCARPELILRSQALRPLSTDLERAVAEVCTTRRRASIAKLPPREVASRGRLLGYFPGDNLCDGAAAVASDGFFDDDNIPAWETWVAFVHISDVDLSFRRCLIAWVPDELVPRADLGIQVNPEQCIVWLDGELDIRSSVRRAAARH